MNIDVVKKIGLEDNEADFATAFLNTIRLKPTIYLMQSLKCYNDFELTMVYNKIFKSDIDCVTDENIRRIKMYLIFPSIYLFVKLNCILMHMVH